MLCGLLGTRTFALHVLTELLAAWLLLFLSHHLGARRTAHNGHHDENGARDDLVDTAERLGSPAS